MFYEGQIIGYVIMVPGNGLLDDVYPVIPNLQKENEVLTDISHLTRIFQSKELAERYAKRFMEHKVTVEILGVSFNRIR